MIRVNKSGQRWRRHALIAMVPILIGFRMAQSESPVETGAIAHADYFERGSGEVVVEAPIAKELTLPDMGESLPREGSWEYKRRIRELGLDPNEVQVFTKLMETGKSPVISLAQYKFDR